MLDSKSLRKAQIDFAFVDRGEDFALAGNITGFGTSWPAPTSTVEYTFTLRVKSSINAVNVTESYQILPYGGAHTLRAVNTEKIFSYKKGHVSTASSTYSPLVVD